MRKATRTISGVTPVAVMAKPFACPGNCVYCPSAVGAPKSYTTESPAVLRAIRCGFDPVEQVRVRVDSLAKMGHPVEKIELIIMGGTFLAYPVDYQYSFVKSCYDALNGTVSADLEAAKLANESSFHRCVGLCVETRPDWCGDEEVRRLLDFGATRVELGVQTLDDAIHALNNRGHGVAEIIDATSRLRRNGFKVYYHWMPGLPGSTPENDLSMTQRLFDEPEFRPDGLKLYPTVVVSGSELESWYNEGVYRPGSSLEMRDLLIQMKQMVPPYVRIARLMRDIPTKFILAGCDDLALRSTIRLRMKELGLECQCVRCREYGHRMRDGRKVGEPEFRRMRYETADGYEEFLSYEDADGTLFALLRLSCVDDGSGTESLVGNAATVRELHVFGPELVLGERREMAAQHRGLGSLLMEEAERIAATEMGAGTLRVLSGVGVRDYYRQLGYALEGSYMMKSLLQPSPV
ncbi:MAG: tRNA uridine(34) 5-carboxymethylaminomethyl modification radical SAM/GNAT enzyme Elp3 [Dehalococcoidia bacterium]|nr:tRNA uridine(34) 5-carboxymethylaminomethyl modification radical SAM/GNAT enzyme Elp3 [Dehalococcoidia bacterium]